MACRFLFLDSKKIVDLFWGPWAYLTENHEKKSGVHLGSHTAPLNIGVLPIFRVFQGSATDPRRTLNQFFLHFLLDIRPGGIGGTVETRLHSHLEIFCHFENCKAEVSRRIGLKRWLLVRPRLALLIPFIKIYLFFRLKRVEESSNHS